MSIEDNDPNRRNLIASSLALIIYFYAGGSFKAQSVNLQLVNIEFSDLWVFKIIIWIVFLWFLYRYWLKNHGKFSDNLGYEVRQRWNKHYVGEYLADNVDEYISKDSDMGYHIRSLTLTQTTLCAELVYGEDIKRTDGKVSGWGSKPGKKDQEVVFKGFKGLVVKVKVLLDCFWKSDSFSDYLVPYLLAFIAILGGVLRLFGIL